MNDLILNGNANLPAHAQNDEPSNLAGDLLGAAYPKLTFKGNRFRVKMGGDERVLGNTVLNVLVLEANPHVSRIYYDSAWDGETATRPVCASADGDVPLPSIKEPQCSTCSLCPMNEKGSAVTDTGGKTRACSFYKRVVVLLIDEPALGPLVADMKAMSMFGRSYPDKGHFSLRDYAKRLADNKVAPHAVITALEFDTNESVPKILMSAVDYTSTEFHNQHVAPLLEGDTLEEMVRTDTMNTTEDEGDKPSDNGFRDKLIANDAPSHASAEEDKPEPKPEPSNELTPQQKAAATRKKNAEKKKADAEKAAKAAEAELNKEPPEQADVSFDDDLEDALSEFGF